MNTMKQSVNINGFEMRYICFGSGQKTLVMIPGMDNRYLTDLGDIIEAQYASVKDDFTVYLFDRRTDMPEKYTVYDMAEDTVSVMNYLNLKNVCLLGTSQGGMISLCIALKHPELISKMIVCASSPVTNELFKKNLKIWEEFTLKRDGKNLAGAFADSIFSEDTLKEFRESFLEQNGNPTEEEYRKFLSEIHANEGFDIRNELSKIKTETLIIGCKGDRVFGPEMSELLAKEIGCSLYMYGNEFGHAVCDESPDFIPRCKDFFC